jgi:two-component sensor histidine kinase
VAYYFASQLDVTEKRRIQTLEEAEHRLLLEVDHRTKNVLAIVDSVVRLSRTDSVEAYSTSVQQRVHALARTHMLLAENGWKDVGLDKIVRTQVGIFGRDNVKAAGPPVMVPAPSVQPIGLALRELAANAAVHGALAHTGGSLEIGWQSEGSGLVLDWKERGLTRVPKQQGGDSERSFSEPYWKSNSGARSLEPGATMASRFVSSYRRSIAWELACARGRDGRSRCRCGTS